MRPNSKCSEIITSPDDAQKKKKKKSAHLGWFFFFLQKGVSNNLASRIL